MTVRVRKIATGEVLVLDDCELLFEDVLAPLVSGQRLILEALQTLTERIEALTIDQAQLDADLATLKTGVEQIVAAYMSASTKAGAAGVDLSTEDALVNSLAGEITAALTPAPASTTAGSSDPAGSSSAPSGDSRVGCRIPARPSP